MWIGLLHATELALCEPLLLSTTSEMMSMWMGILYQWVRRELLPNSQMMQDGCYDGFHVDDAANNGDYPGLHKLSKQDRFMQL